MVEQLSPQNFAEVLLLGAVTALTSALLYLFKENSQLRAEKERWQTRYQEEHSTLKQVRKQMMSDSELFSKALARLREKSSEPPPSN